MDQLVTKETALLAKEMGFDLETVFGMNEYDQIKGKLAHSHEGSKVSWDKYDRDLKIPSQQLLHKWLRDNHDIHVWVLPWVKGKTYTGYVSTELHVDLVYDRRTPDSENYEEVYEMALQNGLELLKLRKENKIW